MSKVLRRGGNETVFRTAVTTVGPDSESAEPGDATVPGDALDRSTGVRTTTMPALLLERLDGALATAENTVLSPVHRFQHWVEEDLRETRGTGPREPLYVSFLKMPRAAPVTVLVVMILGYIAVFGTLTYRQQSNYGTFGFDMGIYDQGIWLTSRFKDPFVTIMGLGYFGHHVNLITLLFIPAYWLGAGPHFLYAVETVWLAAGAVPVWLLARDRLHSSWVALGLAAAYLLYPSVEWINWWHFHPDALIITPLMFAYWLATRRRWGWFWAAIAVALSCKEDAGLAVFALGICLWVKHHERTRGLLTALAGGGWFLVCTKLIIPLSTGGGDPFYITFFPGFGTSIFSIMTNFVVHPSRWVKLVVARSRWQYYAQVFWPVVLLPLLEPLVLLIAVPQLFVNTVSAQSTTRRHPLLLHRHRDSRHLLGHHRGVRQARPHGGRTALHGRPRRGGRSGQQCGVGALTDQCRLSQRDLGPARITRPSDQPRDQHRSERRSCLGDVRHRRSHDPPGAHLRVPQPMDRDELVDDEDAS